MSHNHHHNHSHSSKNLLLVFLLNFVFAIAEIIGGILTNSMAIISDAIHDLGDSFALGIAYFLEKKAGKPGNSKFSFGYKRFSLLGALINALILLGGSVIILYEAVPRIFNPEAVHAEGMLYFAIAGILVNGFAVFKLIGGKTMNEKVVTWHLLEDVLGWVAVLVAAIILSYTDYYFLDPLLSVFITLYILYNVIKNLLKSLHLFLQGVPDQFNLEEIQKTLEEFEQVKSVHHLHIWSQDGEHHVLSVHIVVTSSMNSNMLFELKQKIKDYTKTLDIYHATIEIELENEDCFMD